MPAVGPAVSATCNGCGRCCDPVPLPYTQEDIARVLPGMLAGGKADRDFVLHVLKPISRREGLARSWYSSGKTAGLTSSDPRNGKAEVVTTFFYECSWYDRENKRCTNYENRPPLCRSYPWYEGRPDPQVALPAECSFNADVGRPVAVSIAGRSCP